MKFIEYKTPNIKGAYLYAPEAPAGPLPLVIWLTGGGKESQLPLTNSLGKYLDQGILAPDCAVLMPAAAYRHNYSTLQPEELVNLTWLVKKEVELEPGNVSLCGWSLGSDAASALAAKVPMLFSRVCLISNWPKAWAREPEKVTTKALMLCGAKEKSAANDWEGLVDKLADAEAYRIEGYDHVIGNNIWLDEKYDLIGWLTGKEEWRYGE